MATSISDVIAGVLRGLAAGLAFAATLAPGPTGIAMGGAGKALGVLAGLVERGFDVDVAIATWQSAMDAVAAADARVDAEVDRRGTP